ncbi:MAG: gamma-glutamylcyclotransferase [Symploca sp. SIO2B6]|nr:gamma-glutamylcyclotransferase [Symploca sp. SIO2B6]
MLIFGYGSLVNVEHLQNDLGRTLEAEKDFRFCQLQHFRRCWTVAMDNRINIPGYKYYVDVHTGQRPNGFVTFLNIRPCQGTSITGIVFKVSTQELERLDQRERNYRKLDVTEHLDVPVSEKVYAYVGLDESEKHYYEGVTQDSAIISKDYYELVYRAYESLGQETLTDYLNTTDAPDIPIVHLEKRQILDASS